MRGRGKPGAFAGALALLLVMAFGRAASGATADAPPSPVTVIASLDLAHSFATRSDWRLTATQAPPIADPFGSPGDEVPGAITLCQRKSGSGPCDPMLQERLFDTGDNSLFAERHYLDRLDVVRPFGPHGPPVLLVVTASLHSGDGDHLVLTQALVYERGRDRFRRVYERWVGSNNNQEVRYLATGPLAGDFVAADQARSIPFGYWVTVTVPTRGGRYRRRLRYRSATGYGDGNKLPVIDSEMANILWRLGYWRPGSPLPLPTTACPTPHLIRMELWCG